MKNFIRKSIFLIGGLVILGIGFNCAQENPDSQLPDDKDSIVAWKPGAGKIAWGSSAAPFPKETGLDRVQAWSRLNDKIKSLNGGSGLLSRRSYDSGIPASFAESAMAPDTSLCPVSIGSFKPSWKETIEGTNHNAITKFIQSIPDTHTVYLVFHHEPEDEALKGNQEFFTPGLLKSAFAQFVDVVLSAGKPNVHPCFVLMSYTFDPKSGRNPEDFNLSVQLKPGQIDKVVAGLDGYANVPANGSAQDIFDDNFKKMASWGFTRFGIFETSKHPVSTKPGKAEWITDMGIWVKERKNIELVSWYHSGNGPRAGEKGWYLGEWRIDGSTYIWEDTDGSIAAYAQILKN